MFLRDKAPAVLNDLANEFGASYNALLM